MQSRTPTPSLLHKFQPSDRNAEIGSVPRAPSPLRIVAIQQRRSAERCYGQIEEVSPWSLLLFRSQLEFTTGDPVNWTRAEHGATLSFPLDRDRTRSSSRRSELERALKEWLTLF